MKGFYVDVIRRERVGLLAGPFPSEPEAREWLPAAASMARDLDVWADFDLFGTVRLVRDALPLGILNERLGISIDDRFLIMPAIR